MLIDCFLADKKIIRWENNFFQQKGSPYCAVLLEYEPEIPVEERGPDKKALKSRDSYKELLQQKDWPFFNRLREWRGEASNREGVSHFVIFTNKELAQIAVTRPGSLNALQQIEGVGVRKLEKYGKEIIKMVKSFGKAVDADEKENVDG